MLSGYIEQQLLAVRTAAYGLTDPQARLTPCRSALSIGGLIKHATYVCEQREQRKANPGAAPDQAGFERFMGSFAMTEHETLESVLARFDEVSTTYLADIRSSDPTAPDLEPPAPWDGVNEPVESVQRFYLGHHLEELARHAGHADIIREQIDGASAASLSAAVAGRPANDFVQPWQPPTDHQGA